MTDENSANVVVLHDDSSSASHEEQKREGQNEVNSSFLSMLGHQFGLTAVRKPGFFAEKSDKFYYYKKPTELNTEFAGSSMFTTRNGNIGRGDSTNGATTSQTTLPADFDVQVRLAREHASCRSPNHQTTQSGKSNEKEGRRENSHFEGSGEDLKCSSTIVSPDILLCAPVEFDVLCKNPIFPGCYRPKRCCSPKNSNRNQRTSRDDPTPLATMLLSVKVSELRFYDHPEFIQEERMCAQLQLTYDKYRYHVDNNTLSSLKPKLIEQVTKVISILSPVNDEKTFEFGAKKDSLDTSLESNNIIASFAQTVVDELVEVVSLTLNEIYHSKEIRSTLWNIWKNLQECRTRQRFRSTTAEVSVANNCANNSEKVDDDWHKSIRDLVDLLRQILKRANPGDLKNMNTTTKNGIALVKEHLQTLLIAAETLASIHVTELDFTLLLENTGVNNNAQLATKNMEELDRRRKVTSERYYLRLVVDDRFVGVTRTVSLTWPRFSLPIEHEFKCILTQQPKRIVVQLVQCAPGALLMFFNKVVTSLFVGSPEYFGSSLRDPCSTSEGIAPTTYQFASHQACRRNNGTSSNVRLKGIVGILVNLDARRQSWQSRRVSSFSNGLVCSPDVSKGHFRGLILPHRRQIVTRVKTAQKSKAEQIKNRQQETQGQNVVVKNMVKNSEKKLKISEIVRPGHQFNTTLDLSSLIKLLLQPRKRSLRPSYIPRPLWFGKTLSTAYSLVVTVVSARNLPSRIILQSEEILRSTALLSPMRRSLLSPTRRLTRMASIAGKGLGEEFDGAPVTFVRVRFQGESLVTRAIVGHSPIWKKTFSFVVNLSTDELKERTFPFLQDGLQVELFDATEVDFGTFGGYYDDENTLLTENRFLGAFSVPFCRLLLSERSESLVRLSSPNTYIGYDKVCNNAQRSLMAMSSGPVTESSQLALRKSIYNTSEPGYMNRGGPCVTKLLDEAESSTYLKLSIALDPPLHIQGDDASLSASSKEDESVITHCRKWAKQLRSNYQTASNRIVSVLAQDNQGYEWLITRFLRCQNPPVEMNSVHECAYFVSLFPVIERRSIPKILLTSQQFLDTGSGAWGQHGVVLANYFLYLSEKYPEMCAADVYLVFGKANPEREAVSQ